MELGKCLRQRNSWSQDVHFESKDEVRVLLVEGDR